MADFTNRELSDTPVADASSQSPYTKIFEDAYSSGERVPSKMNDKLTVSDGKTNPSSGNSRQYDLSQFIPENSRYMPLAIDLIEDVANGGSGAKSGEVNDLYEAERFQLAHDMHDIAEQFNKHFELIPGEDVGALVLEAQVKNDTENVVDIDIVRSVGSNDSPRQERIDLYNPAFWPSEIVNGKAIDVRQSLNERTYQYEQLIEGMIEYDYNRLNNDWLESRTHRNFIEANRANFTERAAHQMIEELYRKDDEFGEMRELYRSDDEFYGVADMLKSNLALNADNPWNSGYTQYTSPLFDVSRFQRYPSKDLENLIDDLKSD